MNNLALVYARLGQYKESQQLYTQTLKWYQQQPSLMSTDDVRIMNNLAYVLENQKLYSEAYDLYQRVLVLTTHRFGIHSDYSQLIRETLDQLRPKISK